MTDTNNWVYGYPTFITSRFFICRHLILQKGIVNALFFDEVHRNHQYPFVSTTSFQIVNFEQFTSHFTNKTKF